MGVFSWLGKKRSEDTGKESGAEGDKKIEVEDTSSYDLYVLTEDKESIIHSWLNNLGIYPAMVSSNIDDMLKRLIFKNRPVYIIAVESGRGIFAGVGRRSKLIDLLGLADDSSIEIDVIYTDDMLRFDVSSKVGSDIINWVKYNGSKTILDVIDYRGLVIHKADKFNEEVSVDDLKGYKVELDKRSESDYIRKYRYKYTIGDILRDTRKLINSEDYEGVKGFRFKM